MAGSRGLKVVSGLSLSFAQPLLPLGWLHSHAGSLWRVGFTSFSQKPESSALFLVVQSKFPNDTHHFAEESNLSCIWTWPPLVAFGQGFPGAGMYSADVTTEYPRNLKGLEILAGLKGLVYMVNQHKVFIDQTDYCYFQVVCCAVSWLPGNHLAPKYWSIS